MLGGSVYEGCLTMLCFVRSGSVWGGNLFLQWIVLSKGGSVTGGNIILQWIVL